MRTTTVSIEDTVRYNRMDAGFFCELAEVQEELDLLKKTMSTATAKALLASMPYEEKQLGAKLVRGNKPTHRALDRACEETPLEMLAVVTHKKKILA